MINPTSPRRLCACLGATALLASTAWAQTTLDRSGATDDPDEPVVLSPFEVRAEQDRGYRATNSVSATRVNAQIKDVPINIEAITSEFIQDTGATNLRDALRYSSGVVLQSQNDAFGEGMSDSPTNAGANDPRGATRNPTNTTYKIRGFVTQQTLRDGLARTSATDTVNIERVEVVRGPSALLYGVGSFGGIVNYLVKQPDFERVYGRLGLEIGNHDMKRAVIEYNTPLGSSERFRPAFRLSGSMGEGGDFTDHYSRQSWFLSPSFSMMLTPKLRLTIDNEWGGYYEDGVGFQNIRSRLGGSGAQQRRTEFITKGAVDERTFRWSGGDTYQNTYARNHMVKFDLAASDALAFQGSLQRSVRNLDTRQVQAGLTRTGADRIEPGDGREGQNLGNGMSANAFGGLGWAADSRAPNGVLRNDFFGRRLDIRQVGERTGDVVVDADGQPDYVRDAVIAYTWADTYNTELRDQARLEGSYNFDLWGKHTFILGATTSRTEASNTVWRPLDADNNRPGQRFVEVNNFKNIDDLSPFRFGTQPDGTPDVPRVRYTGSDNEQWATGYYGVYMGRYWDDRITLIGGVRRDRNDQNTTTYQYWREYDTIVGNESPELVSRTTKRSDFIAKAPTKTSPQVGASFAINRELSVFGVYSTGLVPRYFERDGFGAPFPATQAKNTEYGIKFDLLNGNLSGTISAFKIQRENTPVFIWWAPAPGLMEGGNSPYDPSKPRVYQVYGTPEQFNNYYRDQAWWQEVAGNYANLPGSEWMVNNPAVNVDTAAGKTFMESLFAFVTRTEVTPGKPEDGYTYAHPGNGMGVGWPGWLYTRNGAAATLSNGQSVITNSPGLNFASYVPLDDESKGWDAQVIFAPSNEWQVVASYARVERKVSGPYRYVKVPDALNDPFAIWYFPTVGWGTFTGESAADTYRDPSDTSTYLGKGLVIIGAALDDTPEHTASLWTKYRVERIEALKGLSIGLGMNYESKRQYYSGVTPDGTAVGSSRVDPATGRRISIPATTVYTPDSFRMSLMLNYQTTIGDRPAQFQVNVDNLLDDKDLYGFLYAEGRTLRASVSVEF